MFLEKRPRGSEPREIEVRSVMLAESELALLKVAATRTSRSLAGFIRHAALKEAAHVIGGAGR
jgi:uncharacterized protein (DUF1778 family)